ncbi:MAG: hypothetical protein H6539_00125 [Bacteroidales bacterium]|nr:hypothetical protein [Bacteroidales bacterium]
MIEKSIIELNREILDWWKNIPDFFRRILPTFIHELNKDATILFVGLNPGGRDYRTNPITSIREDEIKGIMDKERVAIFGEGSNRIGQYKRYYKWLSSISDELESQYEHYDLFHMSYGKSKKVLNELFVNDSILKDNHQEHLSIYDQVLEKVNPKVVITNNVNTANILKSYRNLKSDHKTGLYKDDTGRFYYLSGIMSYGRQTQYDKERLIWQVKKVL